jgi:cytochrome P450
MEIPVMQPSLTVTSKPTVHQRYRQLLRSGFSPQESAALIALADGIARHAEGESPASTWRWQEISRLKFLAHLASNGRLGGPDDGQR